MASVTRLQQVIGYDFADEKLLGRALTHRSFSRDNNERLEFLGDAILDFVIAEDLFLRFDAAREGQLSRLRARLVKRETLAAIARDFSLGDYLQMGSGELKSGGFERDSILADALEAVIGAIYLDADIATVRERLLDWFDNRLDSLSLANTMKDSKSRLQELLQAQASELPEYEVVETVGQSHNQVFFVECRSPLLQTPARGKGSSRRGAEQAAATVALRMLGVEPDE